MALTYGFFNAHRVESESGDGSYIYDRTYGSDTFNDYFKGVISQVGVFKNLGDRFEVAPTDPESHEIIIKPGKGLLHGRWVNIDALEYVTFEPADIAYPRWDAVVLRLNAGNGDRTVTLEVVKGNIFNGNRQVFKFPEIAGNDGEGNYTIESTFTRSENGVSKTYTNIFEMPLLFVYRAPGTTIIKSDDIYDNWVVGSKWAPWISQVVTADDSADADKRVAEYTTLVNRFLMNLMDELEVSSYIQKYQKFVKGGKNVGQTVVLDMPGYQFAADDVFNVYYNGLYLNDPTGGNEGEYTINYPEDAESFASITVKGSMTEGNSLNIVVMKSLVGLPDFIDGDSKEY